MGKIPEMGIIVEKKTNGWTRYHIRENKEKT
jgi:hypothetical protein